MFANMNEDLNEAKFICNSLRIGFVNLGGK